MHPFSMKSGIQKKTYCTSKSIVQRLNEVNDCANRGVKSAFDFADATRKSSSLSNILQVAEKKPKDYPDLRKKDKPNYKSNFILPTAIFIAN